MPTVSSSLLHSHRARWLGWLLAGALLGLCRAPAAQPLDLERLEHHADIVVRGVCTRVASRWDPLARLIVSDATIAVRSRLKGETGPTLTVTYPGGELPERNLVLTVPHAPRLRSGEESLLFLARDARGILGVVGGDHGRIPVLRAGGGASAGLRPLAEVEQAVRDLAARSGKPR